MTLEPTPVPSTDPDRSAMPPERAGLPPASTSDGNALAVAADGAARVDGEPLLVADVTDLASTDRSVETESVARPPRSGGISSTAAFVGGALLALVGIVSLGMALSGTLQPSAAVAAPPPSPSVPLVAPTASTPADLAHGRTLGLATAPVKVEIWEDFQCPICAKWNSSVKQQLIATYVRPGKVQLTFRDFIVIGRESIVAAIAARIADRDGKFWPFADQLFANQVGENAGSFAPARLVAIAAGLHMDWRAFQTALLNETEDPASIKVLQDNQDEGVKLGITGTPSVVVNGTLLPANDWATVSVAIDKALAGR